MVYIGVDLHRKKSQVAALDQDGKLLFNRKVSTGPAAMQQVIDELREGHTNSSVWRWGVPLLDPRLATRLKPWPG